MRAQHTAHRGVLLAMGLILNVSAVGWAGPIQAFSLREAIRRLEQNQGNTVELRSLGGITRFCGMVVDREHDDLILVGRVRPDLPEASLDDLVVALRCRLLGDGYPSVSIDMVKDTATTGLQEVRFGGGIEQTAFGKCFLESDVLLKRYSLDLLESHDEIDSYLKLYEEEVREKLRTRGFEVQDVRWLSDDESRQLVESYKGRTAAASEVVQSRFWFHVRDEDSFVAEQDDVYMIDELQLGVKMETVSRRETDANSPRSSPVPDRAGERFAAQFTERYRAACDEHPGLRQLKTLFDLVCIAEGIAHLGEDRPNIDYLLHTYRFPTIETQEHYPLMQRVGEFQGSNGDSVLLQLSGGLELEPVLLALEDGDVSVLKQVVLAARPSPNALSWTLPLDDWAMPNDDSRGRSPSQEVSAPGREPDELGCSLDIQAFTFSHTQSGTAGPFFRGFSSPRELEPLRTPKAAPNVGPRLRKRAHGLSDVAGVLLDGSAGVVGDTDVPVSLLAGDFSLILDGPNDKVDPDVYRKFVTALWAVYYSDANVGISIDPVIDPNGRWLDRHMVRYIGHVVNTDLSRVMREADYLMKQWSVGTTRPAIEGFHNPDDISAKRGYTYLTADRFWFVPDNLVFRKSGNMLLFDQGRMTLRTESLRAGPRQAGTHEAQEWFAQFFTEHYDQIARRYPVYQELFEYAKLVGLAKYLKESGVPLGGFLMTHQDLVLTEGSPGTVLGLTKPSEHFQGVTIQGGVDLGADARYVYDAQAVEAINKIHTGLPETPTKQGTPGRQDRRLPPERSASFDINGRTFTLLPHRSVTSHENRGHACYETDLAIRAQGLQLTEDAWQAVRDDLLCQVFAEQWNRLMETESGPRDDSEMDVLYQRASAGAQRATDPIARDLRTLVGQRYPSREAFLKAVDDAVGERRAATLESIVLRHGQYRCNLELVRVCDASWPAHGQFGQGNALLIPYRIQPAGTAKTEFLNAVIPQQMILENLISGRDETLTFSADKYEAATYLPPEPQSSRTVAILLLSDASYLMIDKLGNQFTFDPAGRLTDMCFAPAHRSHIEYLDEATSAFETPPYHVEPVGSEQTRFAQWALPKTMQVQDLVHNSSEILTFDPNCVVAGYVPNEGQPSRFRILAPMSDASFRLLDKHDNEIVFSPAGDFTTWINAFEYPMAASLSAGPYRIDFSYSIDGEGKLVTAAARLSQQGNARPLCSVYYTYDDAGRLRTVTRREQDNDKLLRAQATDDPLPAF